MAKSKKSKILASMLAVSTMAVFYAAPVMAGNATYSSNNDQLTITVGRDTIGSDGLYWDDTNNTVVGTLTLAGNDIAQALTGESLTLGNVTANTLSAANNSFTVDSAGRVSATRVHSAGGFIINGQNQFTQAGLTTAGTISAAGGNFNVDSNANVTGNNFVTNSGADLNTIAENTAAISKDNSGTRISDRLYVDSITQNTGGFWISANGMASFSRGQVLIDYNGNINLESATSGNILMRDGALVDGVDVSTLSTAATDISDLQNKTQNITWAQPNATSFKGSLSTEGSITSGNGAVQLTGNWGQEAAVTLRDASNNYATLTATKLATINNVIDDEGNVVGNTVKTTSGADLDVVNGRTQNMTATAGNTTFTGTVNVGDTRVTSGGITTDVVSANEAQIGNTLIQNNTVQTGNVFSANYNLETVGANLGNLQNDFNATNANVAGIKRTGSEEEGWTTTIEDTLGVSEDSVSATVGSSSVNVNNDYIALNSNGNGVVIDGDGVSTIAGNHSVTTDRFNGTTFTNSANGTSTVINGGSISTEELTVSNGTAYVNVSEGGIALTSNGAGLAINEEGLTGNMGNASFNLSNNNYNVTVGNSTVTVNGNGTTFTNGEGNGETVINGGRVDANNFYSANYDLETVGANLGELQDDFDTTNANVAGISRQQDENGVFYTNVEGTLTVSEKGLNATKNGHAIDVNEDGAFLTSGTAAVYASNNTVGLMADTNNYISITNNGIGLKGNVVFDTDNYGSYTLSGLVDKVEDIYNRTQGIDYDEATDTTTIDGNLNVKGDAETGAGGDSNVDGDVNAGGDITAVGDVNGSNGNFKDKVTVGEAGDQTVIDGGTITTGDTTIKGDGINVGEGTHIGDGVVSSTNGNFGNISSNTGTIGNATFGQDNTTFGTGENQTTINDSGVTVGGENGTSIKHDEITVGDGGYIGGGDVKSGEGVSLNDTANRVGNLEQGVSELNNRVGELEDRIDKVGAMAAAIANLRTMGYDPAAPTEVAVGLGQYRDETGAALGLFHYPNRDFMLSLSVSTAGDEVMGGIGATWKFGRKSPEKVAEIKKAQKEADIRRAEAQKLEKAEAMKAAAKEAKIKAQQERHAKLAAERAAQAEG